MKRVQENIRLTGFDVNKYTLVEPSGENMLDEDQWKSSIDISRMQLEYQKEKCGSYYNFTLRFDNLLLLEKFGSNAWRMSNDNLDATIEKYRFWK